VLAQAGRLDILVNNAGLTSYTPGIEVSSSEIRHVFGMEKRRRGWKGGRGSYGGRGEGRTEGRRRGEKSAGARNREREKKKTHVPSETNFFGTIKLTQLVAHKYMIPSRTGTIVSILITSLRGEEAHFCQTRALECFRALPHALCKIHLKTGLFL
jgi:NAD(P)-dependent dehydrogenase (short-subunit alcohol dehydrogenase family)